MRFLELQKVINDNIKIYEDCLAKNNLSNPRQQIIQNVGAFKKAVLSIDEYSKILTQEEYDLFQTMPDGDSVFRFSSGTPLFNKISALPTRINAFLRTLILVQNALNLKKQEENYVNFKLPEGVDIYEKIKAINDFKEKFNKAFHGSLEMKYKQIDCGSDWLIYTIVGALVSKSSEALVMLIFSKVKQKYLTHKENQKAMHKEACYSQETKKSMEKDEQKFLEEKLNEIVQDIEEVCKKLGLDVLAGTEEKDSSKQKILKTLAKLAINILEAQEIEVHPSLNPPKYLDKDGYVEMEELNKIIKIESSKVDKVEDKLKIENKQKIEEKDKEE